MQLPDVGGMHAELSSHPQSARFVHKKPRVMMVCERLMWASGVVPGRI